MTPFVGILHPGSMGAWVAATIVNGGYEVAWASEGRSEETRRRAEEHRLIDAGSMRALCDRSDVLISVCPPHAAEEVAFSVLATGFQGLYVDANATSPQTVRRIMVKMQSAGIDFVDGSILGMPSAKTGTTRLYLAGERAPEIARLCATGPLETEVISAEVGQASALKMCYAGYTKGSTALLCLVMAAAQEMGVRESLERHWSRRDPQMAQQNVNRVRRVTQKAWRYAGEMEEIAETMSDIGLPDDFHVGAADLYSRIADFKDSDGLPKLIAVLEALVNR